MAKSPTLSLVTQLPALPPRPPDSNKGNFGRVLVLAGSRGMSGAAVLTSSGALRAGAGLVRLATPADVLPIAAAANPCYMTVPLPQDDHGRCAASAADLLQLAEGQSVLAIGPGLGRSPALTSLLAELLPQLRVPVVLDADGLNNLVGHLDVLGRCAVPLVLTPHPGELARLLGCEIAVVQARRAELAAQFAAQHRVVLVLKGHGTVVADGAQMYVNATGNPGMATGGSGDVLTGVVAALLAQGLKPFAAAQLGVYLHGRAGDLARDELGEVGLIATDLLDYLPQALRRG